MSVLHVMTMPESLIFLRGQATFMRRLGLELTAVTAPGPYANVFSEAEGVTVFGVPMTRTITPLGDLRALRQLIGVMRRVRPDIVHAHTPKGGLLGMLAAFAARVPARIYHMRGLPLVTATGHRRLFLYLSEWVACRLAHRVFAVSQSLCDAAIAHGLVSAGKVRVFFGGSGNGVDATGRFSPGPELERAGEAFRQEQRIPADATVIAFVGRLSVEKGLPELAEAWRGVRVRFPLAYLVIVGPKEPRDAVGSAVLDELAADERVRLVGGFSDPRPIYACSDFVVLPSHREGFPNVPLEAAALGLPVITTDAIGCRDAVVDGVTGLVVPVGDVTALGAAIERYLADAGLRAHHGLAGRARVLVDFVPSRIWDAYHSQYLELLGRHPAERVSLAGKSGRRDAIIE